MNRLLPGQLVRISDRAEQKHHRVPGYAKGQTGVISELCSYASPPEQLATSMSEPETVPVYRVRISLAELWNNYRPSNDSLEIEIYEHWLSAI